MITINANTFANHVLDVGAVYEITNVKMLQSQCGNPFYVSELQGIRGVVFTTYTEKHYTSTTTVYIDLTYAGAAPVVMYTEGD